MEKGPLTEEPPDELPRKLHGTRRSYRRDYERMDEAFNKRRGKLDSDYLSELAKLEKAHPDDEALATHIQSEKERLLAGAWGPITDLRIGLPGTRWINDKSGDIRSYGTDGKVDGHWNHQTPERNVVIIHWNADNKMPTHLHDDGKTLGDYSGTWSLLPKEPE